MSLAEPSYVRSNDVSQDSPKVRDRLALRLSTEYMLRSIDLMQGVVGGDLVKGLIFMAIVQANIQHIMSDEATSETYSEATDSVPDEIRRPVSVHALSVSLNIPYETTRRYVNKLMDDGYCRRAQRGLIVPAEVLAQPHVTAVLKRNYSNLQRLVTGLRRAGIEF